MKRLLAALTICVFGPLALCAQGPATTELPGKILSIKQTWTIGGEGNWDYLAFDSNALLLFVAHGPVVQAVDLSAGRLAGTVGGMRDAHGIALDDTGQFGYVSDGPANRIRVFDRRMLQVVASVPTGPNPRAVVYEPVTKLVFAICTEPLSDEPVPNPANPAKPGSEAAKTPALVPGGGSAVRDGPVKSVVTVIDTETRLPVANLLLPGKLGFAQPDGRGRVFINIVDRNQVASFDAQAFADRLRRIADTAETSPPDAATGKKKEPLRIDWSGDRGVMPAMENRLSIFRLGPECRDPRGLAVDAAHLRIFAACDNRKMEVLNSETGQVVASLTIGPGTDAIAYDANRGLIFTANGGGLGSLTVIRQSLNDTYAVIQELPTEQRARTLAVNPSSGEVYLVTNLQGFDLNRKGTGGSTHALPVVQAAPVQGSFQVLVIGN
jgi:DNA-binding beta-propeller fold protein YncE